MLRKVVFGTRPSDACCAFAQPSLSHPSEKILVFVFSFPPQKIFFS
jgi:hypothetical protein